MKLAIRSRTSLGPLLLPSLDMQPSGKTYHGKQKATSSNLLDGEPSEIRDYGVWPTYAPPRMRLPQPVLRRRAPPMPNSCAVDFTLFRSPLFMLTILCVK